MFSFLPLCIIFLTAPSFSFGVDIKGAEAVINQLQHVITNSDTKKENPKIKLRLELAQDMSSFEKENKTLGSNEAAREWVLLVKRFLNLPRNYDRQIDAKDLPEFKAIFKTTQLTSFFEIIPGPEAWPEIGTQLQTEIDSNPRTSLGLKSILLFIDLLNGNIDQVKEDLASLEQVALSQELHNKQYVKQLFSELKIGLQKHDTNTKGNNDIEAFSKILEHHEVASSAPVILQAPDLLKDTDNNEATTLITRAILSPSIYLTIPSGEETKQLAVEISLNNLDKLQHPQWGLVNSIECVELFEKLYAKFNSSEAKLDPKYNQMIQSQEYKAPFREAEDLKKSAISYYIIGLLSQNKLEKALDYSVSLEENLLSSGYLGTSLEATERTDLFKIYTKYLNELVLTKFDMEFLNSFINMSLITHNEEKLIITLQTILERNSNNFQKQQIIKKKIIKSLLAQDKLEEALELFSEIQRTDPKDESKKTQQKFAELKLGLGIDFYEIGKLTKQDDFKVKGKSTAIKAFEELQKHVNENDGYSNAYNLQEIITILIDEKEYKQAEGMILSFLVKQIENSTTDIDSPSSRIHYNLAQSLTELVILYNTAGKHTEVIKLLNLSPWWNAEDLIDLRDTEIQLAAAESLLSIEENEKAISVLKYYIKNQSNNDKAYKLLVENDTTDTIQWLEDLYSTDRFEERPLIWKAYLLNKAGDWDNAEKMVRQAMSIDPTDGEQEAGQRVYSYTLLADILSNKGMNKDAEFFNNVVASVRIAEEGDLLSKAGLTKRSIGHYEKAMGIFADAYCVQWRLAERLYATGDLQGAKDHYKIAFERMPEQFGQVASFCFGCEGAFDKMQSRSAAEEVFTHLIETTPDKPQVYYLYGLLRKSQGRISDAYLYYKKAVELDSEYLDAWKELSKLGDSVYLSREEKEDILKNMLQLDPQMKHFSINYSEIVDWAGFWDIMEQNAIPDTLETLSLYPLPESKKFLDLINEKKYAQNKTAYFYQKMNMYFYEKNLKPGQVLAQHELIRSLEYLITLEQQ